MGCVQGWPGAEKRATLIQLLDKWRGSKVSGWVSRLREGGGRGRKDKT
jgi:hypothetical protein